MGLISLVSSRTYRKHKMASSLSSKQSTPITQTVAKKPGDDLQIPMVRTNHYNFDVWHIAVAEGPIMPDTELSKLENELNLKSIPDMVFNDNIFSISFGNPDPSLPNPSPKINKEKPKNPVVSINFNTHDALKEIENKNYENIKVASSQSWQETRDMTKAPMKDKGNWTFSTVYGGTLKNFGEELAFKNSETQIDYARLKDRTNPILKHEDIILYEDELDDNGQAQLRLRFRLMKDCFFVLVRLVETRLFCVSGEKRIIKESCYRELDWKKAMSHPKVFAAGNGNNGMLFNPDMLTHTLLEDKSLVDLLDRDDKKLEEM